MAASSTAALFFGENTIHGSILLLIHALIRSFRVELLAFALFSLTVRTRKLRSMSPVSIRLRRLPLPRLVLKIAYRLVSGFAGESVGPCAAVTRFFTAATPTFPILNIWVCAEVQPVQADLLLLIDPNGGHQTFRNARL